MSLERKRWQNQKWIKSKQTNEEKSLNTRVIKPTLNHLVKIWLDASLIGGKALTKWQRTVQSVVGCICAAAFDFLRVLKCSDRTSGQCSCARQLFSVCGSRQFTTTPLIWWQEAGTGTRLPLVSSVQSKAVGAVPLWVQLSALFCTMGTMFEGFWAAGTHLRDHVDTALDPPRPWLGGSVPKNNLPLGSSGHLFGSVGHSSRGVGINTGQSTVWERETRWNREMDNMETQQEEGGSTKIR